MPPTLDEMALKDHPVRLVVAFVEALDREDWVEMGVDINIGRTGMSAYHRMALLGVWGTDSRQGLGRAVS